VTTRSRKPLRACGLLVGLLVALLVPVAVSAHAELESSTPADGATVESPFVGPIALSFTEAMAPASEAELRGPTDAIVATATVDGPAATMTFMLDAALDSGEYEVRWTTVADDGHIERGTFGFTVTPAPPSPEPTPEPTPSPSSPPTGAPSSPPPSVQPSASASPSPSVDGGEAAGTGDVLLPIIVALIVVGAGGVYLLTRRNRPTPPG
jgi:methionine-rich copper-binding protein CopC